MSQPAFTIITSKSRFSPGPPSFPSTPNPYADSQAESAYSPARQFSKACQRSDEEGLICAEPTSSQGQQARCEACWWAHSKCEVEIDGNLVRMEWNEWSTNLKKWVYVDQLRRHISELPFNYVEDSPLLTDVDDHPIVLKEISHEWEEDFSPWFSEVKKVESFERWESEDFEIPDEEAIQASQLHEQSQSASTEDELIHKRPFCPSSGGTSRWNPIIDSKSEDWWKESGKENEWIHSDWL